MFGWFKKSDEKHPELSDEQLREEQDFIERNASKKTTSGETTKIVNLTLEAMNKNIEEKRTIRKTAKDLQLSISKVGARLHPKKA